MPGSAAKKSLLSQIAPAQSGPISPNKKTLKAGQVYEDINQTIGMLFKMICDFVEYHPKWLFKGTSTRRVRSGARKRRLF